MWSTTWLAAALHYIFNPYSYLQLALLLGNRSQVDSSFSFFLLVYERLINKNKSGAPTTTEAQLAAAHNEMCIKGREGRTHRETVSVTLKIHSAATVVTKRLKKT